MKPFSAIMLFGLTSALVVVVGFCVFSGGDRTLDQNEVESLFNGSTVVGRHLGQGYRFTRLYDASGQMAQTKTDGTSSRATWQIMGNELCVEWLAVDRIQLGAKAGNLCRTIHTDDGGGYWKVLIKRNGSEKTIVRYESFANAAGADVRVILPRNTRLKNTLFSGWGLLLLIAFSLPLFILFKALAGGKDDASSTRNLLHRSFFMLSAGGVTTKHSKLRDLPQPQLDQFLKGCFSERRPTLAVYALEAVKWQSDGDEVWKRIWGAISGLSDERASEQLKVTLRELSPPSAELTEKGGDFRFAFLLGNVYKEFATDYSNSDETMFNSAKASALRLLDHVRKSSAAPPPVVGGTAYRGSDDPPPPGSYYAEQASAGYEVAMYLKYTPPPVRVRSSSFSSGGGGG